MEKIAFRQDTTQKSEKIPTDWKNETGHVYRLWRGRRKHRDPRKEFELFQGCLAINYNNVLLDTNT